METTGEKRGTFYNVEALKAIPIEDLLQRLSVERKGKRFWCPSCKPGGHKEHKRVNLSTGNNRFFCHTCGAYGDTIELVKLALGTDFKGAGDYLSREFGVPMLDGTRRGPARRRRPRTAATPPEPKRETPADVSEVYEDLQRRCSLTGEALDYCVGRGWSRELLQRYDVRAIDNPARIFRELTEAHGTEALLRSGVAAYPSKKDEHGERTGEPDTSRPPYLRFFRHPILFPFYSRRSFRVEYVQARRLCPCDRKGAKCSDPDKHGPKYMGAAIAEGRALPCLWNDMELANVDAGETVHVTEGIPDALSLCGAGLAAVAVIGTQGLFPAAVRALLRFDVVLCGDRDDAGRKFNSEGPARFAHYGKRVKFTLPPEGFNDWNDYYMTRRTKT